MSHTEDDINFLQARVAALETALRRALPSIECFCTRESWFTPAKYHEAGCLHNEARNLIYGSAQTEEADRSR